MASQAVNVNSTLNYIASVTGIPIATVRSWFPNESSQRNKILNIKSAVAIFNKMLQVGFGVTVSSPVSSTYDGYACSANTLKSLYSKMMTGRAWNLKTATSQLQYGHWYNSLTTTNVSGSATGGSGGGSGSAYGADTFDVTSGSGANGGPTRIYKNGTEVVHMAGGAGGAGIQVTGGKSAVADDGNAGSSGTTGTYSIDVVAGDKIGFFPAYGGGGSCGVRSPNTYVGPSASYASGANASNAGESTNNNSQGGGGGGRSGSITITSITSGFIFNDLGGV